MRRLGAMSPSTSSWAEKLGVKQKAPIYDSVLGSIKVKGMAIAAKRGAKR
jgi:hypothetical protein